MSTRDYEAKHNKEPILAQDSRNLMSSLEIRRATKEDREAVLKIDRDIFCGEDPLPWYYDKFISDPLFDGFIGIKDDKVIAFQNGHVIDGGSAFITRLGRISKEFRRTGLHTNFGRVVWKKIMQDRATKRIVFATMENNPLFMNSYVRERSKQIMTRNVERFLVKSPCDVTRNSKKVESNCKLTNLTEKSLRNLLDNQSMTSYLFPWDRIVIDWIPLRIMPCNLPLIMVPEAECVSDLVASNTGVHGLLSVGTYLEINMPGFCYNIAVFGSDIESLHDHILFHLNRLSNLRALPTLLMVYTDPSVVRDAVKKLIETFDVHPYTHHLGYDVKSLIVMEYDSEKHPPL